MITIRIELSDDQTRMLNKLSKLDSNEKYIEYEIFADPELLIAQELSVIGLIDLSCARFVDGIWHYSLVISRAGDFVSKAMEYYPLELMEFKEQPK